MAKYNYDKTVLKGLSVKPFLGEVDERNKHIEAADTSAPKSIYNSNILAQKLHPNHLVTTIKDVIDLGIAKAYVLSADELPFFRAGQYLSITFDINGVSTCRPYTICSGPADALENKPTYTIVIKKVDGGLCSNYALKNWKKGTKILSSAPLGQYYYTSLRDSQHVIALAGGSGITPFFSMASAIATGIEDFDLTIIYGSRTEKDILLKHQLDELEKMCNNKLKVVHVLSDENNKNYENGFITSDLIKKYAESDDFSLFVCGPPAMYAFTSKEISELDLPQRRVRFEVPGESLDVSNLNKLTDAKHNIKVHIRDDIKVVEIEEKTTIMRGLENAGIHVPSDCRSGKCGWCRSRLISGDVYMPTDNRRAADDKFGWIHPCSTYAKSDIEIEIYPTY